MQECVIGARCDSLCNLLRLAARKVGICTSWGGACIRAG